MGVGYVEGGSMSRGGLKGAEGREFDGLGGREESGGEAARSERSWEGSEVAGAGFLGDVGWGASFCSMAEEEECDGELAERSGESLFVDSRAAG